MMSEIRYSKDHEYVRVEGGEGVVGITDYAQQQLGDVVFAETPAIGKALKKGDPAAVVESVKAASDVFAPVSGEVIAVNSRSRIRHRASSMRMRSGAAGSFASSSLTQANSAA